MSDDDEPEIDSGAGDPETPADEAATDLAAYTRKLNKIEQAEAESRSFWTQVLAHPIGRRELWAILTRCGTFQAPFVAGPTGFPDHFAAWHRAGEHAVGNSLFLSWLKYDRAGVLLMLEEHHAQLQKPAKPRKKRGS